MPTRGVISLGPIRVVTADLIAAEQFYCEGFGFERSSAPVHTDDALQGVPGMEHVRSQSVILRLGHEELELVSYDPPGRGYPHGSTASDLWFQHIAIVVADIQLAYDALVRRGQMIPISAKGPERLPPNSGSVTVFKFRDPEGHPIELSEFPPGVGAARWHVPNSKGNCLGIDHSAMSVADVDRSVNFYCGVLGMRVASRSVNRGIEQDRLDGFASDGVDIVPLRPFDEASPHVELLGYHPPGLPSPIKVNDIAATQLTLQVNDLEGLFGPLQEGGWLVGSGQIPSSAPKATAMVRDPDGHLLLLRQ